MVNFVVHSWESASVFLGLKTGSNHSLCSQQFGQPLAETTNILDFP